MPSLSQSSILESQISYKVNIRNRKTNKQTNHPHFWYLLKTQLKTFSIMFLSVLSFRIYVINFI